jgi:hypothetical protein
LRLATSRAGAIPLATSDLRLATSWSHDEWDVALADGGMYRIFRDRETDRWFIEGIVD